MTHSIQKPNMVISPRPVKTGQGVDNQKKQSKAVDFDNFFQQEIKKQEGVRFSAHAAKRLQSRQITITENQQHKLNEAVEKAQSKGVKDSLVLLNQLALVVNVKNRTVITAMDQSQMNGNMFTNIDGAVIISDSEK